MACLQGFKSFLGTATGQRHPRPLQGLGGGVVGRGHVSWVRCFPRRPKEFCFSWSCTEVEKGCWTREKLLQSASTRCFCC